MEKPEDREIAEEMAEDQGAVEVLMETELHFGLQVKDIDGEFYTLHVDTDDKNRLSRIIRALGKAGQEVYQILNYTTGEIKQQRHYGPLN